MLGFGHVATLEVMNSNLVSMSGVRRQARNFLEVRAVSSWRTPKTQRNQHQTRWPALDQAASTGAGDLH